MISLPRGLFSTLPASDWRFASPFKKRGKWKLKQNIICFISDFYTMLSMSLCRSFAPYFHHSPPLTFPFCNWTLIISMRALWQIGFDLCALPLASFVTRRLQHMTPSLRPFPPPLSPLNGPHRKTEFLRKKYFMLESIVFNTVFYIFMAYFSAHN